MTPIDEQYPQAVQPAMKNNCLADLQVHSEFDVFQKCVKNDPVNEFTGFVGAIDESSVRLYPNFDLTFYYIIPLDQILYVKKIPNDPDEPVKLFVRVTADVKRVPVTSALQPATVRSLQTAIRPRSVSPQACTFIALTIAELESKPHPTFADSRCLKMLRDYYNQFCK